MPQKLNEMLCFAIYSANNAMNRIYSPRLKQLNLTYPQYLVMVSLWEQDKQTVGSLCKLLYLESSTLTPMLKRLEAAGYVTRVRNKQDERQVFINLTKKGSNLSASSDEITACIAAAAKLDQQSADNLQKQVTQLHQALANFTSQNKA